MITQMLLGVGGGTTADTIAVPNATVSGYRVGATAEAYYTLASDGKIYSVENTDPAVELGSWVVPNSSASNYEVFATVTSGTLDFGTSGSWLALSSTRTWGVTRTTFGTDTTVLDLQIRRVGTTTVLDTATITLEATYDI